MSSVFFICLLIYKTVLLLVLLHKLFCVFEQKTNLKMHCKYVSVYLLSFFRFLVQLLSRDKTKQNFEFMLRLQRINHKNEEKRYVGLNVCFLSVSGFAWIDTDKTKNKRELFISCCLHAFCSPSRSTMLNEFAKSKVFFSKFCLHFLQKNYVE